MVRPALLPGAQILPVGAPLAVAALWPLAPNAPSPQSLFPQTPTPPPQPGVDISRPASTAREAVQALYFAYLGAVKEQDGAAMSLGRVDAFLDSYIEADLQAGRLSEEEAQELIDQAGGGGCCSCCTPLLHLLTRVPEDRPAAAVTGAGRLATVLLCRHQPEAALAMAPRDRFDPSPPPSTSPPACSL